MSYDINHVHVSGAVERFDVVNTKTGTPMIRFTLRSWKEKIQVVAFKELAATTLLRPGDRVEVKGSLRNTRWTDKDGIVRFGFEIAAQSIGPESAGGDAPDRGPEARRWNERGGGQGRERPGVMVYRGGPF